LILLFVRIVVPHKANPTRLIVLHDPACVQQPRPIELHALGGPAGTLTDVAFDHFAWLDAIGNSFFQVTLDKLPKKAGGNRARTSMIYMAGCCVCPDGCDHSHLRRRRNIGN